MSYTYSSAAEALDNVLRAPAIASLDHRQGMQYQELIGLNQGSPLPYLAPYAGFHDLSGLDQSMNEFYQELALAEPELAKEEALALLHEFSARDLKSLDPNQKAYCEKLFVNDVSRTLGIQHDGIESYSIANPEVRPIGAEKIQAAIISESDPTLIVELMHERGDVVSALNHICNHAPAQESSIENTFEYEHSESPSRGR